MELGSDAVVGRCDVLSADDVGNDVDDGGQDLVESASS